MLHSRLRGRTEAERTRVVDAAALPDADDFRLEVVPLADLHEHPRNYQEHPEDQIAALTTSLLKHGWFKNVVVSYWEDSYTILAGHGISKAARRLELSSAPCRIYDIDPFSGPALEILITDNETPGMAQRDDRALTENLKFIHDAPDASLEGTGFDEMKLANLVAVTRPLGEIKSFNAAAHWVGMPDYEPEDEPLKLTVSFANEEDREAFFQKLEITDERVTKPAGRLKSASMWWPVREREDPSSLIFEG